MSLERSSCPQKATVDHNESLAGTKNPPHAVIESGAKQVYHPDCVLDLTLDFSVWCPSCLAPDGTFDAARRCRYCYARGNKMGYPKTRTVDRDCLVAQLRRRIKWRAARGLPTRCLRLGKKMDAGHLLCRDQFVNTLMACAEVELPPVIPTKYLEFDPVIADLLLASNAILMPSFGSDSLEPGAVLWGMTQQARVHAGYEYQDVGVCTVPFVLVDPTQEDVEAICSVANLVLDCFNVVQLLPIRLCNKLLARQLLGGWEELVLPGSNGESPKFEASKNGTRIPVVYHPTILELVGDNTGRVRMCAHNSQQSHCGACFLPNETGKIITTAPKSDVLAPLAKTSAIPSATHDISKKNVGPRRPS